MKFNAKLLTLILATTLIGAGAALVADQFITYPGERGPQGEQGTQGPAGPTGSVGPIGLTGSIGPQGATGLQGSTGAQGIQGPTGAQGPSGAATCPNGPCVSLQAASPGVVETGNINVSGTIIAGTFSGSGSSLTSLNATNLSSGTVADGRLSSNVALLNAANVFTGTNTINKTSTTAFRVQNDAGATTFLGVDTSAGILFSSVADSASAVGFKFNTSVAYSTAGAKLLSVSNNGIEKFVIDKDGFITTESVSVSSTGKDANGFAAGSFRVRKTTNSQSPTPGGAGVDVTFNAEDWDVSNWFDTSNSRFTPTIKGYYRCSAQIYMSTLAASQWVNWSIVNTSTGKTAAEWFGIPGAINPVLSTTGTFLANGTTDNFQVNVSIGTGNSSTVNADGAGTTHFTCELIGKAS